MKGVVFRKKNLLVLTFRFIFQYNFRQIDGEELYKTNCTACHVMTDKRLVGLDLRRN